MASLRVRRPIRMAVHAKTQRTFRNRVIHGKRPGKQAKLLAQSKALRSAPGQKRLAGALCATNAKHDTIATQGAIAALRALAATEATAQAAHPETRRNAHGKRRNLEGALFPATGNAAQLAQSNAAYSPPRKPALPRCSTTCQVLSCPPPLP